jgi:4-amino-4-deoxy-L-arabinose transferase-like glycosyltransferase
MGGDLRLSRKPKNQRKPQEESIGPRRAETIKPLPDLPWRSKIDPWLIAGAAFLLRAIYLLHVRANDPFYDHTLRGFDQHTYQRMANEILDGDFLLRSWGLFYYSPLYGYFSALVYWIGGRGNFDFLHLVQLALAVGSCVLLWALARSYLERTPAFLAGVLAAGCQMWLFYEQILLMEGLVVFLQLTVLYLLRTSEMGRRFVPGRLLIAGLASGFAFLGRGNFATLMTVFPLWILWRLRSESDQPMCLRAGGKALLYLCGAGAVLLPMGIRSYIVKERFVVGTTNGPAMLYLGNAADATGEFAYSAKFQEAHAKSQSDPGVYGRTMMEDLRTDFGAVAWGLLRKTYYFWNGYDIPDNTSIDVAKHFSPLLRWNPITFQFLAVIGLLGAGLLAPRWRELSLLYLYAIIFSLSIVAIVPVGRYKLPITIPLMIFAAHAITWLIDALRTQRNQEVAWAMAVLATLALLTYPFPFQHRRVRTNDYYNFTSQAIAREKFKHVPTLIANFAHDYPHAVEPHLLMFSYLVESEQWAPARGEFQRLLAAGANPESRMPLAAAKMHLYEGNRDRARMLIRALLEARPDAPGAAELLKEMDLAQ